MVKHSIFGLLIGIGEKVFGDQILGSKAGVFKLVLSELLVRDVASD